MWPWYYMPPYLPGVKGQGGKESSSLYLCVRSFYIFFPASQMLWALTFLEKPQTVSDWGHVMHLWLCLHGCGINSSGLLTASQGESRNLLLMAVPLKCLRCCCRRKRQGCRQSSSAGIAIACFNEPWQPRGEDPGASQLWGCQLPRLSQKSPRLPVSDGEVATGGVCSWGKMQSQREGGEIKMLTGVGALWNERIT